MIEAVIALLIASGVAIYVHRLFRQPSQDDTQ